MKVKTCGSELWPSRRGVTAVAAVALLPCCVVTATTTNTTVDIAARGVRMRPSTAAARHRGGGRWCRSGGSGGSEQRNMPIDGIASPPHLAYHRHTRKQTGKRSALPEPLVLSDLAPYTPAIRPILDWTPCDTARLCLSAMDPVGVRRERLTALTRGARRNSSCRLG